MLPSVIWSKVHSVLVILMDNSKFVLQPILRNRCYQNAALVLATLFKISTSYAKSKLQMESNLMKEEIQFRKQLAL